MLTKTIPYTFVRGGYFYFSRRVPADLRGHYSYHRIVQGLHTTSPQKAKVQASITAAKLEAYWSQMRLAKSDVIGMSLVWDSSRSSQEVAPNQPQTNCPSLIDALEVYLLHKGKGRPKTFRVAAERSCNYLIGLCGNKPLSHYRRQDALQFRDWLVARGLTGSSITRNFSCARHHLQFEEAFPAMRPNTTAESRPLPDKYPLSPRPETPQAAPPPAYKFEIMLPFLQITRADVSTFSPPCV